MVLRAEPQSQADESYRETETSGLLFPDGNSRDSKLLLTLTQLASPHIQT